MKQEMLHPKQVMLKNQINPHFLFNSLNVLASLAYQDTEKTNRFAKKLSTVYRLSLIHILEQGEREIYVKVTAEGEILP